ncbi:DNA cytosine methyltransferase [Cryptosporangium minutisporangium]|uniref:DNA (cytosine-5-)-methyltransferase n=1 Tax=Cryptosporangium minutisporangium TaxID=113569 RepID=A0ABP6SZS6_9ACTN
MTLTFTDIFCGAGGSSIGLTAAGFELKLAANHWPRAIETHAANFRDAEHLCADVNNYDMRRLPRTSVLWASPICTEMSPAGGRSGGRQSSAKGQLDLLEFGPIAQAGFERTRATFHDVIRATEVHRYQAVIVENVVDVVWKWELFDWWVEGMCKLGYQVQFVSVSSAHVGGEDNPHAPQWRDRLYIVFTRTGIPLPDVAPRPLAWCPVCETDVNAVQAWRNLRKRKVGKYRQQYDYRCPNATCRNGLVEPYVLPAATAIDWSDLGTRIGDRPRPLAAATMRRITAGLEMFATEPSMITVNHGALAADGRAFPAFGGPLPTRTVRIGDGLAIPPLLVPSGGTWNTAATSTGAPMRTRLANEKGFEGLTVPPAWLTVMRNHSTAEPVEEPLSTITTSGHHHYLTVAPPDAFYVKNYGGHAEPRHMVKRVVSEPLGVLTAQDHHALVIPYRKGTAKTTAEPLHTLATRESAALVRPTVDVEDCSFRMLKPREHLRGQRFPDEYLVTGNQGEQTMQAGNAVSSNVAQWLATQIAAVLSGHGDAPVVPPTHNTLREAA